MKQIATTFLIGLQPLLAALLSIVTIYVLHDMSVGVTWIVDWARLDRAAQRAIENTKTKEGIFSVFTIEFAHKFQTHR